MLLMSWSVSHLNNDLFSVSSHSFYSYLLSLTKFCVFRLESLLIEYPPEEVEAKRWSKIADALGNRTPIQVIFYSLWYLCHEKRKHDT